MLIALYPAGKWIWGETAEAYFNHRCGQDSGEFIYRTVDNVKGVFQMRPRDPREYFSRLRKGDLMEDPYGHTNREAQRPWYLFLRYPKPGSYSFFETEKGIDLKKYDLYLKDKFSSRPVYTGEKYWIYKIYGITRSKSGRSYRRVLSAQQTSELKSKYGFTWRQFQNERDSFFGVIGGELIVKELATNETLGVRRGYFSWPPWSKRGGICPKRKHDNITYEFVSKVLRPAPFDDSALVEKVDGN